MSAKWLRPPLPKSIYGRSALILIAPIVIIQLVVSIVFVQRHFEGVTEQMTRNIVLELNYLRRIAERARTPEDAIRNLRQPAGALAFGVAFTDTGPTEDTRLFYDFSGRIVMAMIRDGVAGVQGIDLKTETRIVTMRMDTEHGPVTLEFSRRRVSASNPHQLIVLIVTLGLLLAGISYIFLRNQLRPIRRLAKAAEAFGRGQSVPYRPSGAVEIRSAGSAFLDMRARIERAIDQRTLMLSGVSHDLRTPLTRLKLELSLMEPKEAAPLIRDVEDMERLLDTFLNFARGNALDALEDVDPVLLAERVVEKAAKAGQDVTMGPAEAGVLVSLRPLAVERALENLVGNSVRYASACRISVTLFERAVRFRVEDNGAGIAPEDREMAVKPFARLDPARNQNKGPGVGLGLSIAIDIARSHGGTLRLGDSEAMGGLQADLILAR